MPSMNTIPEYTTAEIDAIKATLQQRYGKSIGIELVDTELRLDLGSSDLTQCPAVYWQVGRCNFVVSKTGIDCYRCQFFYGVNKQFGTGIDEYNDIAECVISLLRAHADHRLNKKSGG